MYALVIVLNDIEYLQEVISTLKKSGIRGATILDGMGSAPDSMSQLNTASFLASIVASIDQRGKAKKVILSLVERSEQVEKAINAVNELVNSTGEKTCGAFMMTLPVNHMRGGELERHINRREAKKKSHEEQR